MRAIIDGKALAAATKAEAAQKVQALREKGQHRVVALTAGAIYHRRPQDDDPEIFVFKPSQAQLGLELAVAVAVCRRTDGAPVYSPPPAYRGAVAVDDGRAHENELLYALAFGLFGQLFCEISVYLIIFLRFFRTYTAVVGVREPGDMVHHVKAREVLPAP